MPWNVLIGSVAEEVVQLGDDTSADCCQLDRLTCAVLVHLHWPVVHLSHCLHLNVVAMAIVFPLPIDVCGEVLCYIVGEIVCVLHLKEKKQRYSHPTKRLSARKADTHQIVHAVFPDHLVHVLVPVDLIS